MLTDMIPSSVLIAPMKEKILCITYWKSFFRKLEWKTIRLYSVYKTFFFFYSDKVRKLNSQGFMDIFICKLFNLVYFVKYMMLFCLITMQRLIQEKARRCNMKTGKCKSSFKLSITADIAEVCYLTEYED